MREQGGERVPALYRLVADRTGQSTAVGFALIIAITVIGTGFVVALGSEALSETERATTLSRAEQSMTRFDSQASMVALGETPTQAITLAPSRSGQYDVNPDAGWLRVTHRNYTTGNTETIYNATLGSLTYRNGDTTVAYQGGGVWRKTGNGSSLISPPEFHYRSATLTLPVIRIANEDAGTGQTEAFVQRRKDVRRVYPNETSYTGDGVGAPYDNGNSYRNPVVNGTVIITVHSDYYQGWAQYFRERTQGVVSVDHANQTTTVELVSVGKVGSFNLADALDDDGLDVRGQSPGHSVTDLNLTVVKDQGTFNNMYVSFHAEKGDHRVEFVVHYKQNEPIDLWIFYRNLATGAQHEWYNGSIPATSGPIRISDDETRLIMNLTSFTPLTYTDTAVESDQGSYYDWSGSPTEPVDLTHSDDGEPRTVYVGNTSYAWNMTRHYLALYGEEFSLRARLGTGSRANQQVNVGASGGNFDYEAGAGGLYITYLHISENEIRVELR